MTSRAPSFARRAYMAASIAAIAAVLLIFAAARAILVYAADVIVEGEPLYQWLLREDGPVETPTAALLGLASLVALIAAVKVPAPLRWARLFLVLFAAFSAWMSLEEISFGERIFNTEPGAFFQEHSDQNETNFHNVMQRFLKRHGVPVATTRQIAAIVLFGYGVLLPILKAFAPFRSWFRACRVVVPPPALIPGFLLGAALSWFDRPTGREEELGELLFSLCFALLVPLWLLQQTYRLEAAASDESRADADR
jgi:hypothetical protein